MILRLNGKMSGGSPIIRLLELKTGVELTQLVKIKTMLGNPPLINEIQRMPDVRMHP